MTKNTQNRKELLSPELVIFLSLKNSPISSNHRNFHQNWWQKKHKIWWNYCHQNWWHFRHSKTHQFLQFTKNVTKIGKKFGENSIENECGLLPLSFSISFPSSQPQFYKWELGFKETLFPHAWSPISSRKLEGDFQILVQNISSFFNNKKFLHGCFVFHTGTGHTTF